MRQFFGSGKKLPTHGLTPYRRFLQNTIGFNMNRSFETSETAGSKRHALRDQSEQMPAMPGGASVSPPRRESILFRFSPMDRGGCVAKALATVFAPAARARNHVIGAKAAVFSTRPTNRLPRAHAGSIRRTGGVPRKDAAGCRGAAKRNGTARAAVFGGAPRHLLSRSRSSTISRRRSHVAAWAGFPAVSHRPVR